jgi:16S rRNA A1518/A1519 N6-dimethyltransferase RsmA/KsgA/DIM1 with predicted DNA glycosylase/AP lyase activity
LAGWLKKGRDEIEMLLLREGVDPRRRGETLSVDEFIRLAHALKNTGLIADS